MKPVTPVPETHLKSGPTATWPKPSFTLLLVLAASLAGSVTLLLVALGASENLLLTVAIPVGLALGIAALGRPQLVMVVLAGLLIAESLATVKGISLYKAMTPVIFAGIALQYAAKRLEPIGLDMMDALVFLWVLYNAVLIPASMDSGAAMDETKRTFNVALFYVMVSRLFVEPKWRDRLAYSIIGFAVVLVLYGLATFYTNGIATGHGVLRFSIGTGEGLSGEDDRLVEPNLLAAYLFLPLFLLVGRIQTFQSPGAKLVGMLAACALVAAILLTYSRSAFVVLVAGLVLFAFRSRIQPRHVLILGFIGLVSLPLLPASYWARIGTLVSGESATAGSLVARASLIDVGAQIFRENPVFGIGPGNFLPASALSEFQQQSHLIGRGYVAHNLFLEVLAETGLVGFVLFMSLILLTLVRLRILASRQPRDALIMALELAFVTFLLSSLFQSTGTKKALWLMLGLVRILSDPIVRDQVEAKEVEEAEEARGAREVLPTRP